MLIKKIKHPTSPHALAPQEALEFILDGIMSFFMCILGLSVRAHPKDSFITSIKKKYRHFVMRKCGPTYKKLYERLFALHKIQIAYNEEGWSTKYTPKVNLNFSPLFKLCNLFGLKRVFKEILESLPDYASIQAKFNKAKTAAMYEWLEGLKKVFLNDENFPWFLVIQKKGSLTSIPFKHPFFRKNYHTEPLCEENGNWIVIPLGLSLHNSEIKSFIMDNNLTPNNTRVFHLNKSPHF